ncbi:MBL fold metallo-hydrolase [Paenibacillus filicis]|uniref:MBL fold metallo-hydrolase n=1 Tax=Paenibacillus gyeongsangnamensis TaxID=3388067 RepID=A0ABT4Q5M6_9BACL|nr:MBL fold metallo-hydrolase [Paenibacillus filicis]MCZ8512184.1 MBL fold metallo-hydrolase [Paenibacillus filicis]
MSTINHETTITFLGTSTALPDAGSDTASLLINRKYLVDTGWSVVSNLRKQGVDPTEIEYLFFTHMHHDHYLSLPSLLFYFLMKRKNLADLKIIGPIEDLERVVKLSMNLLQADRFYSGKGMPTLIPLQPGEPYEDEVFTLHTCETVHPVQGLCYRFTDKLTGKVFSFTGDTAYHPPMADHVRGSSILITEASLGPVAADMNHNPALHSGAVDAARMAEAAEVDKLFLVHGPLSKADACVEAAKQVFSKPVEWPKDGQTITL